MPRENYQKVKLLYLHELLLQETDEQHPLTTQEICARLGKDDIICDRRTLTKDVNLLNQYGFEIMSMNIGHEKAYYVKDRSFSLPEIKILMDSVQAAAFITDKKTAELVDKLASLGGVHKADLLKKNIVCFNTRKHTNEQIFYSVDVIEDALENKKKLSFYYFDLNEKGERVYRKNKKRYVADPTALIYNEDNYYLMCYSGKYEGICNYRVDRMDEVQVEDENVMKEAVIHIADAGEYTKQVFKMYGGQVCDCAIEFDDTLIGVVYDKFGEDTEMIRLSRNKCIATVKIQVSPTFWGWIFQFVGRMRILSPNTLAQEYKDRCQEVLTGEKPEVNDDRPVVQEDKA
ncbi:helix-turn-helix transcriptional regulator [Clostridium vitabionis]|uniref:helix-turn-helix transcriptional regulator n=1 Tax=Clostridium vitabionis TaxID=2784388 RepID=UPI00188BBF46|nr:WYL domain-containing protein [Clostridium vitabionis]